MSMCAVCWHKCIKYIDCCILGHCKPPCRFEYYSRCCCGVCCRLFFCVLAFVAFFVAFAVSPMCVEMVNVTDISANVTGRSVPDEVLIAVGTGACKYLTTGVLVLMAILACCVLVSAHGWCADRL